VALNDMILQPYQVWREIWVRCYIEIDGRAPGATGVYPERHDQVGMSDRTL
jgi:hypothetical protein